MKKKTAFLAVVLLLMSVSFAQALPQYAISDTGGRTTSGGPFHVIGNGMDFLTFCVESQEYVTIPGTYYGSIDDQVWYSSGSSSTFAPVATETAKLYSYYLDNEALLTNAQEGQIQLAIWDYQNQPGWDGTQGANPYYTAAPGYTQTHPVMALNLWTNSGGYDYNYKAQSMLVPTPIPAAAWLLGSGLLGLAAIRRRRK